MKILTDKYGRLWIEALTMFTEQEETPIGEEDVNYFTESIIRLDTITAANDSSNDGYISLWNENDSGRMIKCTMDEIKELLGMNG